jgi:SAM-dependent methyltransferase
MLARIPESETFLSSFTNVQARAFVNNIMKHNYTSAILTHHPRTEQLDRTDVARRCNVLVDTAFERIFDISHQPEQLFPLFASLSRSRPDRGPIWFDDFVEAYQHYKHQRKLQNRYHMLRPYLHGHTYADVGCGGGDFVAFLRQNHAQFTEFSGIDVMDWRTAAIKEQIGFQMLDFSQPDSQSRQQYDTLTCLAVLHHVGNTNEAQGIFLQNLRNALRPEGRLIIEEDVILPAAQIRNNAHYQQQVEALLPEQPNLGEFLAQDAATQRDSIILIDFLANALAVGVPEMAFPCGFHSIDDWCSLFVNNGFSVYETKIAGFVPGNFNQSSHVHFMLTPS